MNRTRSLWVGVTFPDTVVALGIAPGGSSTRSRSRKRRAARAGAALRGRSVLAQADAEPLGARQRHRRLGRRAGQRLDRAPQLGDARRDREGARAEGRRMLCGRAADPGVRQAGQSRPALGRPGSGLRLAGVEPRHLRRSHRHGVDRRQRPRRLAHHEVHQGREVRGAVRQAERARDRQERAGAADLHAQQQRPVELRTGGEDLRRSEGERSVHRRRLLQPARRRARRLDRRDEALLGRVRQASRTTRWRSASTIRPRRPSSTSATRCTAPICRTTASSTSATA